MTNEEIAAILREGAAKIRSITNDTNFVFKASNIKPTFKPNKDLGEGRSSEENLAYRQELLDLLENVYKDSKDVLNSKRNPNIKIGMIDKIIEDYISDGKKLIESQITEAYTDGAKYAAAQLKKLGAKPPKIEKNPERLDSLIRQQQMNLEDSALTLRGRLRQLINVSDVMGYYKQG